MLFNIGKQFITKLIVLNFIFSKNSNCLHQAEECRRFANHDYKYVYAMPLLPDVLPFKIGIRRCEKPNTLIVGGQNATYGEFPHMVAVGHEKKTNIEWFCGGSLISKNHVLTAAHCTTSKLSGPNVVRLGAVRIDNYPYLDIKVQQIIVHPNYKPPIIYNDIALLELNSAVNFNNNIKPACVSMVNDLFTLKSPILIASGWGHTSFGGKSSSNLLKVPLKIIKNEDCQKDFNHKNILPRGLDESLFCAVGHIHSTDDTCQCQECNVLDNNTCLRVTVGEELCYKSTGTYVKEQTRGDSGGPLQTSLKDNECTKQIIGITSFGKYCGSSSPAVYTKVAFHMPWIESVIQFNDR